LGNSACGGIIAALRSPLGEKELAHLEIA